MKKIFKKALSVFLATLMCLMAAPVIALAADEQTTPAAPVFSLDLKNETADEVSIVLTLKENSFNCLDLTITGNDNLVITAINFNVDIFITGGSGSSNLANGKISFARADVFVPDYELVTYTFKKLADEGVCIDDFDITIDSCGIGDTNAESSSIDVTDSVVLNNNIPAVHTHTAEGDWVVTTEPTCADEGEQVRYCGICGEVAESEAIDATGHKNIITDIQDPTCTEEGIEKEICDDCGEIIKQTSIPATNHPNTKTEHKDATCFEEGYDKVICEDCGETVSETPIAAKHGEKETQRLAPTCTEDGYIREVCTVCGETVKETVLESKGHRYITDIKNPTCTEDGYVQSICPACQDVNSFVSQPKTGHSWLEWTVIQQPTHAKEGVERRICKTCGIDEERSVPKLVATPSELVMNMQEIGMNYRQTTRLFVNVLPEEAAYSTEIVWESSDPSVATVDEDGAVYAVAPGTATITARTADGSLSVTCEVTVKYSILQWIIIYLLFGWIWYV